MNQLVSIHSRTFGGKPTPSVNAQDLYSFLSISTRFNDWITRRITEYGFIKGEDYLIEQVQTGGRPRTEHYLTIDTAKELAMVEKTEKGKQARRYFIECEKQLRQSQAGSLPSSTLPAIANEIATHIERRATEFALTYRSKAVERLTKLAMDRAANHPPQEVIKWLDSWGGLTVPLMLFREDVVQVKIALNVLDREGKALGNILNELEL